jgi:hypothetical protein
MKEEEIAAVQPNTENAEEQSNTITAEQFNAYAEQNKIKVFNETDYNTLSNNLLKDGAKKSFNTNFKQGLEKAKKMIATKFNTTFEDDIKFEDALNSINLNSEKDADIEAIRAKLIESETSKENAINELRQQFKSKELNLTFERAWGEISNNINLPEAEMQYHKSFIESTLNNTHDFNGEVIKQGDNELRDNHHNPLGANEVIKNYIMSKAPMKAPVKGGNGTSELNGNSSNSWVSQAKDTTELMTMMHDKGISPHSEEALTLMTEFKKLKR